MVVCLQELELVFLKKNANIMSAVTQICASRQHSKDINVLVEQARANLRNDVCICG